MKYQNQSPSPPLHFQKTEPNTRDPPFIFQLQNVTTGISPFLFALSFCVQSSHPNFPRLNWTDFFKSYVINVNRVRYVKKFHMNPKSSKTFEDRFTINAVNEFDYMSCSRLEGRE